ncbi:hypothetical protein BZA05DRAFT_400677 [Tricharina praecox]|uniref:uncharacterized protein n=1 Tax=Tricharina praecox TaxID=43433 RepID=UPI0022207B8A|nr:uncharacterized protein BZA05DRAFT_400677 [Tricharina praecox]KAI5850028.1 hypothetical protein BZA05DRAFT_400677 [Tricharina praecox]
MIGIASSRAPYSAALIYVLLYKPVDWAYAECVSPMISYPVSKTREPELMHPCTHAPPQTPRARINYYLGILPIRTASQYRPAVQVRFRMFISHFIFRPLPSRSPKPPPIGMWST